MPQQYFPCMVSVDWLEVFCLSYTPITSDIPPTIFCSKSRERGSKLWQNILDLYFVEGDCMGAPFGTLCAGLRGKQPNPLGCSLKLANEVLYQKDWHTKLMQFVALYGIQIMNISRVDLAADFLFLNGRVSGRQLVSNIKNLRWWKCGTVNCSEHYTLPYSLSWSIDPDAMEVDIFDQQNSDGIRTESLTFGTKASFAQVCIYDKTLELKHLTIDGVCSKQYIIDAHQAAGVFDPTRHTWRIEIRLNSKAGTLKDEHAPNGLRPLHITDLYNGKLLLTFRAAADVWFRLVDASAGDPTFKCTPEWAQKYRKRKNEFEVVDLFPFKNLTQQFATRPHQETPSRFIKAMINRLDEFGSKMRRKEVATKYRHNALLLESSAQILRGFYNRAREEEYQQSVIDRAEELYLSYKAEKLQRISKYGADYPPSEREKFLAKLFANKFSPVSPMRQYQLDQDRQRGFFSIEPEGRPTLEIPEEQNRKTMTICETKLPTSSDNAANLAPDFDPTSASFVPDLCQISAPNDFLFWRHQVEIATDKTEDD